VLEQFARQNRWWTDRESVARDRHLRRLQESPRRWLPSLPFRFDRDAVYTVRGPRRVGKSTVLKRQIQALLEGGWPAQQILYLDVELAGLERASSLTEALRAFIDYTRVPGNREPARLAIFLDEVTRIPDWAGAIRGLIDNGELEYTTVIATGSHTTDLQEGGERLPGRRGGGTELDIHLSPLTFREYLQVCYPDLALPVSITNFEPQAIAATSRERLGFYLQAEPLFARYLATGGYLTALNDEATYGAVRAETYQLYREAIVGEFTRAKFRESYLREVVAWIAGHLGQEFDSRGIAADTDIGSKDTARHYLDHLTATYVVEVAYRTNSLDHPSPAFRAPKKLHPLDPLVFHLIRAWADAEPDPWLMASSTLEHPAEVGHLVESTVVGHLRRAIGERVYYWRVSDRAEIDCVLAPPGRPVTLAEAKYRHGVDLRELAEILGRGGGLLLTRSDEGPYADGRLYAIPTAELLACIDAPALGPAR
jgi:predicted AAA+ superfamily ATPase